MKKRILSIILAIVLCAGVIPVGILENKTVCAASNEIIVYKFLREEMGLNTAAACGVLANIAKESGFEPDKKEMGYTWEEGAGYGICQWTNYPRTSKTGRRTKLVEFCKKNGYDYKSLEGQLYYLKKELSGSYYHKKVTSVLESVPDTSAGAYEAGYVWCYYFEVPANRESVSVKRGSDAKNKYFTKYTKKHNLSVGGYVGEEYYDDLSGICEFDVAVNGNIVSENAVKYSSSHTYTTEYEINNITPLDGYTLSGENCHNMTGMILKDTKVTLSLEKIPVFINYDANGGKNPPDKTYVEDVQTTLSDKIPTRTGYKFLGWAVDESGEKLYSPSEIFTATETVTLYAIWEKLELTGAELVSLPSKTVYASGEKFNTKGIEIIAQYHDGTTETITGGFDISGFDSSSVGEKTITVSYEGFSFEFTVTILSESEAIYIIGDVNGNGSVDASDATHLLRHINGKTSAVDYMGEGGIKNICDIDGNGSVTASDATQILRHINGKTSRFDQYEK